MPLHLFLRCGIDLLVRRRAQTESFEDYIIEKYGHTLYKVFFKPYTERFLEYKCSNLHRDWATAGINRATIDKKLDTGSLAALVRSVLFSIPVKTKFIYPQSGGIGVFSEKLASGIRNHGATIFLSTQVSEFVTEDRNIRAIKTNTGKEIPVGHVFWSGSLTSLRSLDHSGAGVPRLHYMSSVFYNYFIGRQINNGFQWCYFGDPGIEIDRISVPRNFNPALVPPGKEGLCIEVCCTEESSTWKDPARLDSVLETFLVRARLLSSLDHIEGYHVERVRETYPLYVLNYPRKLKSYFEWVNTTWHNLTLVGRTGRFWYNNMDNSIAASLDTAERFLAGYRKGVLPHGDAYSVEDRYLKGMTPSP
ncbi:MAG: hypothetical protein NTY64_14995 [Deltaproteobacteria bacterium]|nr:hypothetical protein [Deltaproteobacteria bacterium]